VAQDVHLHAEEPFGDATMDFPVGARLLFVNQHYAPDVAATGQCLADLAEHFVRDGYDVEVLAARTKYGAEQLEAPAHEVRNGVTVTRVATTRFGRRTHLGRVIDYASFYVAVLVRLVFGRRYDGVVFLTTPPLISFIGRLVRALHGQRYAIWSMDLHPEAEIAAGMLHERSLVSRTLRWLDALAYRGADFVVDLGPYMRERVLQKGVRAARAHTVNIWGGRADSTPVVGPNPLATHLGLEDRFVVMYSGNAGIVHDFGAIFEAMRVLRDDPRIFFLFVGDGPRRAEVEAFALAEQIDNFAYRDYFPRELIRHSLAVADVHLISLRHQFAGVSVPSKLYGAMASSRPIVFIGPRACETADAIRDARCGITVDPRDGGDAAAGRRLAAILLGWADVRSVREELGARGRCAFLERYEHRLSCAAFETVVRSVWGRQGTVRRTGHRAGRLSSVMRRTRTGDRRAASDPPAATH
jgi:hypothetical protein